MSEISNVLNKLAGTREYEVLVEMEKCYSEIQQKQKIWYEKSKFLCPEGCGHCCINFEPDLLDSEVLYMAAWLLENQKDVASKIMEGEYPFNHKKTCPFYSPEELYHCSIYGGRPSICRLFGASCVNNKNGLKVWKPCKFYPEDKLKEYNPELKHHDFSEEEAKRILNFLPPVMTDCMESIISLNNDSLNENKLIRNILPDVLKKLVFIMSLNSTM